MPRSAKQHADDRRRGRWRLAMLHGSVLPLDDGLAGDAHDVPAIGALAVVLPDSDVRIAARLAVKAADHPPTSPAA